MWVGRHCFFGRTCRLEGRRLRNDLGGGCFFNVRVSNTAEAGFFEVYIRSFALLHPASVEIPWLRDDFALCIPPGTSPASDRVIPYSESAVGKQSVALMRDVQ